MQPPGNDGGPGTEVLGATTTADQADGDDSTAPTEPPAGEGGDAHAAR